MTEVAGSVPEQDHRVSVILAMAAILNVASQSPDHTHSYSNFALRSKLQNVKLYKDRICVCFTFVFSKLRRALVYVKTIIW